MATTSSLVGSNNSIRPLGIPQGTSPGPPAMQSPQKRGEKPSSHRHILMLGWSALPEQCQDPSAPVRCSIHPSSSAAGAFAQQGHLQLNTSGSVWPPAMWVSTPQWRMNSQAPSTASFYHNKEESSNDKPRGERWGNGRTAIEQSRRRPLSPCSLPSSTPQPLAIACGSARRRRESCQMKLSPKD